MYFKPGLEKHCMIRDENRLKRPFFLYGVICILVGCLMDGSRCQDITIKEGHYDLIFNKTEFLDVHFDSSFYKALFLLNKTHGCEIMVLDFQNFAQRKYPVSVLSKFLFIGLLNTGNILIGSQSEIGLMSKDDGYSLANLTEPSTFFKLHRISSTVHFNDFNQTVLVVYDDNKVVEMDVRMPQVATMNQVSISGRKPNYQIRDMLYINGGEKFILLVSENDIEFIQIYDQKSKQFETKIDVGVDDAIKGVYSVEAGKVVFIRTSTKTLLVMDARSYQIEGSINYSLTGLTHLLIRQIYAPLGTNIVIVTTTTEAYFFDILSLKFIQKISFSSSTLEVFWAESTNWFLVKQETTGNPNQLTFKAFGIVSKDARLCHKSCGSSCEDPFRPCYYQWKIFLSMVLGLGLVLSFGFFVTFLFRLMISRSKDTEITDEDGNLYELTETGDVKPKRFTITLDETQFKEVKEDTNESSNAGKSENTKFSVQELNNEEEVINQEEVQN